MFVTVVEEYYRTFTSPNPNMQATIYNESGIKVGHGSYALSPLQDRVYFFRIEIAPNYRRAGYGLAFLTLIVKKYNLPIITIKEAFSASTFWDKARSLRLVSGTLSVSEMDEEKQRWRHVNGEAKRLDELISERFDDGESWEEATGRGL